MLKANADTYRALRTEFLSSDLVVVGGGMAGTCCAITAARAGIKVVLVQDRPVLGGNASSEVRLWILGATSHQGNNNRWAREGGVIDEILVENQYRNPEGNSIILDTIILEKVMVEPNITLLLNTSVYETHKSSPNRISGITAFCSQNSTKYEITAPLFCDASGDGIVGFQSGAAFRMGAESADEFDEPFAPTEEYGELLGHSIYFMTKDLGKPVNFVAPAFALKDITKIPRYRKFNVKDHGCWLWWIEYGGRLDTVHDTETIKWELWKVVYGVWDYIKNSGEFPEAETMTLEWVGHIPGKRESRRFEGHYMLKQSDFVQQHVFDDAVSYGGWAVDLHPADGVFSEKPGCNQWHSKGVYQIPYRCMVSRNIENLFIAGRILSASHVAMGSTRVMATCAHNAQAVGIAAALAKQKGLLPADLVEPQYMNELQQELLKSGQYIPHIRLEDGQNLIKNAKIYARSIVKEKVLIHTHNLDASSSSTPPNISDNSVSSSETVETYQESKLVLSEIPFDGNWRQLEFGSAQLLPLAKGPAPTFEVLVKTETSTELTASLRISDKITNFTPEVYLATAKLSLESGEQTVKLEFDTEIPQNCYAFICLHENPKVSIKSSQAQITGIMPVFNKHNKAVSNFGKQEPPANIGFEAFEFWVPIARPRAENIAMRIQPGINLFGVDNLKNGINRPYLGPNAWVANKEDESPELLVEWGESQTINEIVLHFDTDTDHAMESTLMGHAENIMPFVVRSYEVFDDEGKSIYKCPHNHQTRNIIQFSQPITTRALCIRFHQYSKHVPISLFDVRCY